MSVDPIPEEFGGVTAHLVVADPVAAVSFYRDAFGADEFRRSHAPDGRVWHVELYVNGGRFLLMPPYPEMGTVVPGDTSSVTLHLYVADADAVYASALAAGARSLMEPWDAFWGDRYCQIADPDGHRWSIATRRDDPEPEEVVQRARDYGERHPRAPLE